MRRLSSSLMELKGNFEVVVVGSGYGGGIAASRMARAGRQVCVLERGRELQPGEYPRTDLQALPQLQFHGKNEGHEGDRTALFDFHLNDDIHVLVGCGLGGTSLINANVSLPAEPRVFDDPRWPVELRGKPDGLGPYYRHAEEMLRPSPYPDSSPPLLKLQALEQSAKAMGARCYRPPINVNFAELPGGVNHVGVEQQPCALCGDCVSGCNYGAKNTTLMNYLPDAVNSGAKVFTQVSVRYLERKGDRWHVHFQLLETGRERFDAPTMFITADLVFLGAGTLGSTEILLRSREKGLQLSDRVGARFTGNGDVLAFGYNMDSRVNGMGLGAGAPAGRDPVGPCITGIIDLREQPNLNDGMVIEEGSIPGPVANRFLPWAFAAAAGLEGEEVIADAQQTAEQYARQTQSLLHGPYAGATQNTQTYLLMAHDDDHGQLTLENDHVRVRWPGVGDQPIFEKANAKLAQATAPHNGIHVRDPLWTEALGKKLITVHPLGGCCMADDATGGAVNHKGQVFTGAQGNEAYENLYVCDGAIVPLPLGVNPLLTISALAERVCALAAADRQWTIDYAFKEIPPQPQPPRKPGIRFTETMKGFVSTRVTTGEATLADFQRGYQLGQQDGSRCQFILTIQSDDLDEFINNPQHRARAVGTVSATTLSPEPFDALNGEFQLFVDDPTQVDTKNMVYRLPLESEQGSQYYFHGFKVIQDAGFAASWPQTTTLYVTIYEGRHPHGRVVARGVLHIEPADFARQMTTMTITNSTSFEESASALARFGRYFAGVCWDTYGGIFAGETHFDPDAPPRERRPLRVSAPELHFCATADDVELKLTRFRGGSRGPIVLAHGSGASSFLFTVDTIDTNLTEFLFANRFDVWLLDYRASIALPSAARAQNADEVAIRDWPAAIAKVRELTGTDGVHVLAHCYGSITLMMAMLAGLQGVKSIICSQVATDFVVPPKTEILAGLHFPSFLEALGVDSLTARDDGSGGLLHRLFDKALDLEAMVEAQGRCRSATCHRITFMYGADFEHAQLNQATHDILHEIFGVVNLRVFEHCAIMTRRGHVVDDSGNDVYLPHLERLRLPITFLHAADNRVFLPEATERACMRLREAFGDDLYQRRVIDDYGHSDAIIGKNAARDVYPFVLEHFERLERPQITAARPEAASPAPSPPLRKIPMFTPEGVPDAVITTHYVPTDDGLGLTLTRYTRGAGDDVVLLLHGLTSSSDMYIMPEHMNVVRYLLDHDFTDVWCFDSRMSGRAPYDLVPHDWTLDDVALFDHPPMLKKLRDLVGPDRRLHVICHCMGSTSFMISLFGRVVDGITSVIANSVALTPRVPWWSRVKLRVCPPLVKLAGMPYISPRWGQDPYLTLGKLISRGVSLFHPECKEPACHMLSFMWGAGRPALFLHDNIHEVTHQRLADLFTGTGTNYYRHVLKSVNAGKLVKYYDTPTYSRLPADVFVHAREVTTPILLLTGDTNRVFADSNQVCYRELERLAPGRHSLRVFKNYGHQDVFQGKHADRDTFPAMLDWLKRHRGTVA